MTDEPQTHFFDRTVPFCSTFCVSVIIPMHNASQHIGATCESILAQKNCRFEALFIDAESTDRTLEILRCYKDDRIRIQSAPSNRLFEMINRGIAMAHGQYVQVLYPGDIYLSPNSLSMVMCQVTNHEFPDLFYG